MSHPCPRCGKPTDGAFSEGGLKWAICEDCMTKMRGFGPTKDEKEAEEEAKRKMRTFTQYLPD